MKTSLEIFPIQLVYVTKQNIYTKPSNIWKTCLHKLEIWLETCNIGKELSLTHLKLEAFNNLKNLSCTHLNLEGWNSQQFEKLSSTLSQTSTWKPSTTWRTLFHTLWTLKTWNLKTWRTLFHTWDPRIL